MSPFGRELIITVKRPFNQYGISLDLDGPHCTICGHPIIITDDMPENVKQERIAKLKKTLTELGYLYPEEDLQYFLPACKLDEDSWVHEYCLDDAFDPE